MYLKTLSIRNFRAISKIDVEFSNGVSVIVGPNAIGKTTVLEAIRLAKALLSPRTANEAQQTLVSLGAAAPQNPQQLISSGLVRDADKSLEVRCGYSITKKEIGLIESALAQIVTSLVQSRLAGSVNPATLAAYLSSPAGQQAIKAAEGEVKDGLKRVIDAGDICRLDLAIDFQAGRINTPDPVGAALLAFLDQSLPPDQTKFSYFPADRALPRGDVPVQLGAQDAAQQLESHNSIPQSKYGRLKNTIFNTIIASDQGRKILVDDFSVIFSGILRGRELVGAGINEYGLLSISIKDKESERVFDIDGLSSGEKGLVLTFLLIGRTLADGGIVLLDEPELHLNPAVCKDLLSFMVDNYVKPKNLQLIICSHSPEILAGAFGKDECALYHLVSGSLLTKVRQSDEEEISEALRRLGTSESEGLLYKATVFVEGEHDVEILEAGFGSILRQYKIKDLGGRKEVEKQIELLQAAEVRGEQLTPRYFIFDRDDAPTNLGNTNQVKILQWNRTCLENYLIDIDVITDLLKQKDITKSPVKNLGEVTSVLKDIAYSQLDDIVIKEVYEAYGFNDVGRRANEVYGKDFEKAGEILFSRLESVKAQICDLDKSTWVEEFDSRCVQKKQELEPVWDTRWRELCDGKRLFKELHSRVQLRMPLLTFKKRIVDRMRGHPPSDNWRAVESLLKELLPSGSSSQP